MSLLEVLVASLLLGLVLVGVLELYSLSLLTGFGSAARTDLTYRCQQVVECLRHVHFLRRGSVGGGAAAPSAATGIPDVPSIGMKYRLPVTSADPGWDYWGPAGAAVMEEPGGSYRIFYTYVDGGAFWTVTVTAQTVPATAAAAPGSSLPGAGSSAKSVEYVAQLRKP